MEADFALADEVLSWCEAIGLGLFDWQNDVLREMLAVAADGKWAAYESTTVVARQNGKNEILIARELAAVVLLGDRLVIHSAHEAATSQKHFQRFQDLADQLPEVAKLLPVTKSRGFYTSNGKEHIQFRNGALIEFRTRQKRGARGFSAPLVVLDEAFDLPPKAVGSLMYTLRAKPNPQVVKTSSPAHTHSVVLHTDRKRAQSPTEDDTRFHYVEWANEPDVDPADPEAWARSNPSAGLVAPGFELNVQKFRNEWASARHNPELRAEFVREVVGVPDPAPLDGLDDLPIDLTSWANCGDGDSIPVAGTERVALSAPIDRHSAVFSVAGKRADNTAHVSVRHRVAVKAAAARSTDIPDEIDGDGDLLRDRVVDAAQKLQTVHRWPIVLAPGDPARAWRTDLIAAGVELDELSAAEWAEACGAMMTAVDDGAIRHRNQADMNAAVAGLGVKPHGDVEVWSRRNSSGDISSFIAATAALVRVPQTDIRPEALSQIW